jgi:hypothetical protein
MTIISVFATLEYALLLCAVADIDTGIFEPEAALWSQSVCERP